MMTLEIYNEWAAVAAMTMVRGTEAYRIVNAFNALMPPERRGPICHTCPDSLWGALQAVKKEFAKLTPPVVEKAEVACKECGQEPCVCPPAVTDEAPIVKNDSEALVAPKKKRK